MKLLTDEPLCHHTTLRTGGPARWLLEAGSEADIKAGLDLAQQQGVPVLVLGGGSNVLAADAGFEGIVVKIANRGITFRDLPSGLVEVVAEAGEEWDALVAATVENNLYGLENLSLIPGRVGGAVIGNIGAYGVEVKDALLWADALDVRSQKLCRFSLADCGFAYRHSFFKCLEGQNYIVTRAAFCLRKAGRCNTTYRDVADWFTALGLAAPTPAEVREAVVAIRQRKMPDPARVGTAGSFFKNPVIPRTEYERLAALYPGLPGQDEAPGRVKIHLAWILDKICGLRGTRKGPVGTHAGQALVLVNDGGTAAQVEAFANEVASEVRERTGIRIEWEVVRIEGKA